MGANDLLMRILIVDDDPSMLEMLASNLESRGFVVATARSAGEAVAKIRQAPYTVVISDLKMPILDGLSCVDLIRGIRPETEFILISGQASPHNIEECFAKGVADFISKPLNMEHLLRTLAQIQNRKPGKKAA